MYTSLDLADVPIFGCTFMRDLHSVMLPLRLTGVFLICAALAACNDTPPNPDLFAGFSRVRVESPSPDSSLVAVLIREYGSMSGEDSFGMPWALAVRDDGSLVVSDITDPCTLTVVDRPSGVVREKLGVCGEGPGEFKMITALATDADTLFVYDRGTSYIVVLDPAGTEVRRYVPTGVGAYRTLDDLAVLDDSTLIVTTSDVGRATVESIDRATGELREVWLETTENAEMAEMLRHLSACVHRDADPPMIVAMNERVFEGVGVAADTREERLHFQTSFADLREDGLENPASAGVRCGATMALFSGSTPGPVERTSTSVTFRWGIVLREARDYNGTLRMRVLVEDSGSLLHGGLGAMRGDTLFVMNSTARAYPVVAEFVLEPAR